MANRLLAFLCLLGAATQAHCDGVAKSAAQMHACAGHIESSVHCHWVDGTMSIYNGTPSVRIRQRGGKHVYGVGPAEDEWMPDSLKSSLTPDNAIDARFRVCPMPAAPLRGLPMVCVDDVRMTAAASSPSRP